MGANVPAPIKPKLYSKISIKKKTKKDFLSGCIIVFKNTGSVVAVGRSNSDTTA